MFKAKYIIFGILILAFSGVVVLREGRNVYEKTFFETEAATPKVRCPGLFYSYGDSFTAQYQNKLEELLNSVPLTPGVKNFPWENLKNNRAWYAVSGNDPAGINSGLSYSDTSGMILKFTDDLAKINSGVLAKPNYAIFWGGMAEVCSAMDTNNEYCEGYSRNSNSIMTHLKTLYQMAHGAGIIPVAVFLPPFKQTQQAPLTSNGHISGHYYWSLENHGGMGGINNWLRTSTDLNAFNVKRIDVYYNLLGDPSDNYESVKYDYVLHDPIYFPDGSLESNADYFHLSLNGQYALGQYLYDTVDWSEHCTTSPPPVTFTPTLTANPSAVALNTPVTLTADPAGAAYSAWSCGTSGSFSGNTGTGNTFKCTYPANGTYEPNVLITKDGVSKTAKTSVTVSSASSFPCPTTPPSNASVCPGGNSPTSNPAWSHVTNSSSCTGAGKCQYYCYANFPWDSGSGTCKGGAQGPCNCSSAGPCYKYVHASDPDGKVKKFELVPGHSANLSINSNTGLITWSPSGATTISDKVRVIDDKGLASDDFPFSMAVDTSAPPNPCSSVDDPSGQTYVAVQIGSQCWMKENLNYGENTFSVTRNRSDLTDTSKIEKYCYANTYSKCATYGGLYDWDEIQYTDICPSGWRIPTKDELLQAANSGLLNLQKYGARLPDASFGFDGTYGFYWSGTNDSAGYHVVYNDGAKYSSAPLPDKIYGLSVRCLKGAALNKAPVFNAVTCPDGIVGNTYAGCTVKAVDPEGDTNITYSLEAGTVVGLTITSAGVFGSNQKPTSIYNGKVTVKAKDSKGAVGTGSFDLIIAAKPVAVPCGNDNNVPGVKIGNQCWMAKNLNVGTMVNSHYLVDDGNGTVVYGTTVNGVIEKYCYDDTSSNCDIFGGLYEWEELQDGGDICPSGWRVPEDQDFIELLAFQNGALLYQSVFDPLFGGQLHNMSFSLKDYAVNFWSNTMFYNTYANGYTEPGYRTEALSVSSTVNYRSAEMTCTNPKITSICQRAFSVRCIHE